MKHGTNLFWQIILVLLVVLVALWCATEWTAWSLGWSPWLGEPLFVILDMPVYVPGPFSAGGTPSMLMRRMCSTGAG